MMRPSIPPSSLLDPWVVALVLAAVAACSGAERLDGPITRLDVLGTLQDPAGAPVPGAVISVSWRPSVCGGELGPVPPDTTGADGSFYVPLVEWGTFAWACVHIEVAPLPASGLQGSTIDVDSLPLRATARLDTLRLDLALVPAATLRRSTTH